MKLELLGFRARARTGIKLSMMVRLRGLISVCILEQVRSLILNEIRSLDAVRSD
jgi:hypothetical protein